MTLQVFWAKLFDKGKSGMALTKLYRKGKSEKELDKILRGVL